MPLMRHGIDERAGLPIAAMANLNQRLWYSHGGYEEVPEKDDGLVEHHVRFLSRFHNYTHSEPRFRALLSEGASEEELV
jgi:hypothetical protein